MAEEWDALSGAKQERQARAHRHPALRRRLRCAERPDVLNVGGFSDAVFDIVSLFAKGELGANHWVGEIECVTL